MRFPDFPKELTENNDLLEIQVVEIRGNCPVYKVGDRIMVDDPKIVIEKTDALCTCLLYTSPSPRD